MKGRRYPGRIWPVRQHPGGGYRERCASWTGHRNSVHESNGFTGKLETCLVEGSCEQAVILNEEDVSRHTRERRHPHGKCHQGAWPIVVEGCEVDAARGGVGVNEVLAIPEKLRPELAALTRGHRRHLTALRGYTRQVARPVLKHNHVVGIPRGATLALHIRRDDLGEPTRNADLLQTVCGEESNPLAVARPEWCVRPVGAWQRLFALRYSERSHSCVGPSALAPTYTM